VIAVTEAGGLGTFPLPNYLGLEELKQALVNIKRATAKPIGVNIQLHGRYP
jgi:nitronate monooxygenase